MRLNQRIFQNTIALVIGQSLGVLLSFVSSVFIVRGLGISGYGQYTLIYAFLSLFAWIVPFGMDNILVRESAQERIDESRIWANGMIVQFVFAGFATGMMLAFSLFLGYPISTITILLVGSLEVFWFLPLMLVSRILQVNLQQWRAVTASLIRQLLWLIAAIYLYRRTMNVDELVWLRVIVGFIEVILLLWLAKPYVHLTFQIDLLRIKQILRYSWPLAMTALSIAVYHRIDRVFIERYLNIEQLGYYATADNIASLMRIVPLAFMASVYPTLSTYVKNDDIYTYIVDISIRWVTIFCVGLASMLAIGGPLLVKYIYGSEFSASGDVLRILVWSQIAVSLGVVLSQIFITQNLQKYLLISTLLGSVINIMGNIFLIPIYGIVGSAWATVLSYFFAGIFGYLFFVSTRRISLITVKILLKILLVCGIGIALSYTLRGNILISMLVFLSVFVSGLFISGMVGKADFILIKSMFPSRLSVVDQDTK